MECIPQRWILLLAAVVLAISSIAGANAAVVDAVVTANNAYALGYDTGLEIVAFLGAVENTTSGAIFNNPESYSTEPSLAAPCLKSSWVDPQTNSQCLCGGDHASFRSLVAEL